MVTTGDSIVAGALGRRFVGSGHLVIFAGVAAGIVFSVRAWGERSSVALLGCVVVIWAGSGLVEYGRKLRGELPPGSFRMGRGLLSLPVGLALAYYGPTIEHFGIWWALLLPHLTYGFLASVGLPHLLALVFTIVVAPLELIATAVVSQLVIVAPLSAVLGSENPIVDNVRDLVGGVRVADDPLPAAGLHESTAWAGDNTLQ